MESNVLDLDILWLEQNYYDLSPKDLSLFKQLVIEFSKPECYTTLDEARFLAIEEVLK